MMPVLRLLCLFVAFIFSNAVLGSTILTRTPYAVKDSHLVPRQWNNRGRAPAEHLLHMQIGLKQGNFDELERHLYEGMLGFLSSYQCLSAIYCYTPSEYTC